jgi:hypothetical protein
MSDLVKWGLLTAGLIALIGLIMALPFVGYIDLGQFGSAINNIVDVAGGFFQSARGLINCFLLPFGRNLLSGILIWLFGKWAITIAIKIVAWVYHFIFRG